MRIHLLLAFFSFLIILGCTDKDSNTSSHISTYDNFNGYISNYSAPPVSRCEDLFIQLAFTPVDSIINGLDWSKVFQLKPSVGGKVHYDRSNRRIVMRSLNMEIGQEYKGRVDLSMVTKMPKGMETFEFPIEVKTQAWNFHASHPEVKTMDEISYVGWVDYVDCEPDLGAIRDGFKARQNGKDLRVSWNEAKKGVKRYHYHIYGIERRDKPESIEIELSMSPIGINKSAKHELTIPSKAEFNFVKNQVHSSNHMSFYFSDPLQSNQDVSGLINLKGRKVRKAQISHNRIDVYFAKRQYGYYDFEILPGIKNIAGFPFRDKNEGQVFFEPPRPFVEFAESGHIIPSSDQWKVPINLVSASGFRLRILRVEDHNVHQYFQSNKGALNQQTDLEKVGRMVLDSVYRVDKSDFFAESTHIFDLTNEVRREPKALYKIFLSLDPELSTYPCKEDVKEEGYTDNVERMRFDPTKNKVNYVEDYYYDDYYSYGTNFYDNTSTKREYNNPCHPSYFQEIDDQRLVMCTDIGLVFKSEPDRNRYFAYTSSISSSDPIAGASIELFDYQGNQISKASSNGQGLAYLNTEEIPFLLRATYQGQSTYMHLMEEHALSLSTFQVEGQKWKDGKKLFLYGERGVWRPGDSIYMHCIYFDENNTLPAKIPLHVSLMDPRQKLIKEWFIRDHKMGLFDLRFGTDLNDPTGVWTLELKYGNEILRHPVRIETIRPNRLKMNMAFAREGTIMHNDPLTADVDVKWMHGLEAKDLKTEISMQQRALLNPFGADYRGFVFDDVSKSYSKDLGVISANNTNAEGIVPLTIPMNGPTTYPSQMLLNFRIRAFEKGGAFSNDQKTIKYSPYKSYIGAKWPGGVSGNNFYLRKGDNVQLLLVDENGKRKSGKVIIRTYKIEGTWWYQNRHNRSNFAAIKSTFNQSMHSEEIQVGKEGVAYEIKGRGRMYVEFECVESGHTSSRALYHYDPGYWDESEEAQQVEVLPFFVEDKTWEVGDVVRFNLPSAPNGKYLVTVENGGSILQEHFYDALPNPREIALYMEEDMVPTAYIHVHYIAAYNQHNSHRPLRLFGVQAVRVYNPRTLLKPEIKIPEEVRTSSDFAVSITEKDGRPMAYTLAIVDEGLLDITQFRTPDAWSQFFAKEGLQVKTWDMYRDIFHRFLGEYTSLLAVGGDETRSISPQAKAQRFKPVVKFLGPFELNAGETESHSIKIDEYVGSVRTMVVATNGKAVGKAQETTKVIKPLMLYSTLPRVLGPGEKLRLPVTLFALKDHIKNVSCTATCKEANVFTGSNTQQVTFDKIGEKDIYFELTVPDTVGVFHFEVSAKSGDEIAIEKIEIDVRPSSAAISSTVEAMIESGKEKILSYSPIGMKGTNQSSLTLSRSIDVNLSPYVDQLLRYPHGCLEQSVSRVFPQIYLSKMGLLNDMQQMQFEQQFDAVIQKLKFLQTAEGGFTYWLGGNKVNAWGSSYALHFLVEAESLGFKIPKDMMQRLINYQYAKADRWVISSTTSNRSYRNQDLQQAYRLYSTALAGKPNFGAMNRLRLHPNINSTSSYMLAHALMVTGENDAAEVIMSKTSTAIAKYRELGNTFGSQIRDQAMIVQAIIEKGDMTLAKRLIDEITPYFKDGKTRLSTQDIAFSLMAFSKFIGESGDPESSAIVQVLHDGNEILSKTIEEKPHSEIIDPNFTKLDIKNTGESRVFASVNLSGTPIRDEADAESQDLEMSVSYFNLEGKKMDLNEIRQGADFTITVDIRHPGERMDYENMALSILLPSGAEIINTRLFSDMNFNEGSSTDYKDIRDDRVYCYFSLNKGEAKQFRILANATYKGEYWMPAVFAEAMYDPSIRAKTKGHWSSIK